MSREFFNVQPVQAALDTLFTHWQPTPAHETIPTRHTLGRITAQPIHAPHDLPTFARSAMDGYAVRAADTYGASQTLPAYLTCVGTVRMGQVPSFEIGQGQAAEIHTGGMLPKGADAVVMIERTQPLGNAEIEVLAAVARGEHVIQVGEDVGRGEAILPAGHRLRPQDIGGLLAVGITSIEVAKRPVVGILSGGDELVPPEEDPQLGQIRDINAYTLAALVEQHGGEPQVLGIVRDTLDEYRALAQQGFREADILVMTAGSSVSTRDLTQQVIDELGRPGVLQHGLAVKPGKPTILAVCDGKPVIGLPGNPVSALLVAHQVVVPLLHRALGQGPRLAPTVQAVLSANIASVTGREDTIPVQVIATEQGLRAEPIFGKSNLIYTLMKADGLLVIPLNSGGLKAGAMVEVVLLQ